MQLKKLKKNQFNGMVDHCEVNCICQQSKCGIMLPKEVPVSFYGFALSLKGEHYDRLIHL